MERKKKCSYVIELVCLFLMILLHFDFAKIKMIFFADKLKECALSDCNLAHMLGVLNTNYLCMGVTEVVTSRI